MIRRNLKKEFINNSLKGFTLTELIVGILIASIATLAILFGFLYIQTQSTEVRIKERAYEELKSYTELWKGKIGAGNIPESMPNNVTTVCLENNREGDCIREATLSAYLEYIDTGISHAERTGLKTSIEWETSSGGEKEIEFYLQQLKLKN